MLVWVQLSLCAVLLWPVLTIGQAIERHSNSCDRACLENVTSQYLSSLATQDRGRLFTTPDVKYTENDQTLSLGSGEWKVASSLGRYRHVFSDPKTGQVAAITTIMENGAEVIYVVRLKVENDGRISEIETQITRDAGGAALYEKMGEPEAVWLEAVPDEERITREELIEQTNRYYSGMERNDPHGNYSFFDKDCNRLEDAVQTTNMNNSDPYGHSNDTLFTSLGCEAQFQTGFLGFVTRIRDRRFPVVDEERQAVLAITTLDHNGTVRKLPDVNGTSSPAPPYFDVPRTLLAAEAFRLRGDKLFRIEMTLVEVPYGMRYAFGSGPFFNSTVAGGNNTVKSPCDRACLGGVLVQVLKAMLANDSSSLPLARDAQYSENGQFLPFGDGLWETLGQVEMPGVDEYAAGYADPAAGIASYWGLTKEQSTPGVMALRVKVDKGFITSVETTAVRAEYNGSRGGTVTLMRSPLPVEWAGASLGQLKPEFQQTDMDDNSTLSELAAVYFDGLEKLSSSKVPFTTGCLRRDNGAQQIVSCAAQMDGKGITPNGLFNTTTAVRDRRVLITDAAKGVVMAIAMVDNPAISASKTVPLPATESVPSTYMIMQLIKVSNGKIARVESMIKWMPFGYTSAWSELDN
ncbi:hypothetical protein F5Y19DRAFT_223426 [Xylariaceae sp. FL1651]|nr:hypothetical protein F5Y19DRAFT_223426 [Xylariaceae sp. FL1651]